MINKKGYIDMKGFDYVDPVGEKWDRLQLKQREDGYYTTRNGGVFSKVWDLADGVYMRTDSTNRATLRSEHVEIVDEFSEEYERGWWRGSVDNPENYEWGRSLA